MHTPNTSNCDTIKSRGGLKISDWGFIYLFNVNNKGYVGWTVDLKRRFKRHFKEEKWNPYFHNSLRKHFSDPESSFKILEVHKREEKNNLDFKKLLDEREIFWTKKLDTFDPEQKKGWNLTKGGGGVVGLKRPDLVKQNKKRDLSGENNPNFGKKSPKRTKLNKERKETGEVRGEKNPRAKAVVLISPKGEIFNLSCYGPFCKEHGLNPAGICEVLRGNRKGNNYKGWTGHYLEEK
jgi:group I intron endonuclease